MAAAAGMYQALVLVAALRRLLSREPEAGWTPPVSVLKPIRGLDPHFSECIRSQALQDYPEFEIVFGVSDPADPAIPEIEGLAAEFPERPIRLIVSTTQAPNGKVGVLADLAAAARYPILVVNDSDIRVAPDYLRRVVAPLEDPRNGVVTCLYRAQAQGWPGRFEAVGIATDFAPGVLVAPLVGVSEFGLGATLAFRAGNLEQIGGFAALADYLADDYQLSRRIRGLGLRVVLSRVVVETCLPDAGWKEVWRHQLRWARTIRMSRGGGYLGLPLSNATLWSVALALAGFGWAALALFAVRLLAGLVVGAGVLQDRRTLPDFFLIPLRDLWGAALWAGGLFGFTVIWSGFRLRLSRDGRIVEVGPDRVSGY